MICRRAIGAALAACGTVSRCEDESILAVDSESDSTKADVGRFATTSGVGQRHNVDISRAIAIMERYHAMSLEALHANVDRGKEINVRDQEDGKCPRKDPAILEPISIVQGEPKQRDVKNTPRPKNLLPSRMYTDISDGGDLCVPHVIVGGGTAAWSAVQAIRKRDRAARVLVITEEMYYPYNRTPLSKELWAPNAAGLFTSEWGSRNAVEYTYSAGSESLPLNDGEAVNVDAENISAQDDHSLISIIRNAVVADLDIDEKILTLNNGRRVQYEKLLLATGGVPRSAAGVCEALGREGVRDSVSVFRTLDDFRELRSQLDAVSTSVTVIGAGFLGTELSVAMASEGRNVSLLCAEPGVLYRVLPRYLSEFLSRKLASIGIKVIDGMVVTDARRNAADDSRVVLTVGDGMQSQELEPANKVVVAVGIQPRVELASKAGLEIDRDNGGIVVNHQMNCAADIWAAGDVASFWDRTLGRRRVEHWVRCFLPNCKDIEELLRARIVPGTFDVALEYMTQIC